MVILETFKLAIRGLLAKKLRTFLTMLGITVGVASVIVLLAYGEGTKKELLDRFAQWGEKQIHVTFQYGTWRIKNPVPRNVRMSYEDVEAIRNECSAVRYTVPAVGNWQLNIRYGTTELEDVEVTATEPEYFRINNIQVADGEFFTHEENMMRERVCVIGHNLKQELFFAAKAVGNYIFISGRRFRVMGVTEQKEGSRRWSNRDVFIPRLTARDRMENFNRIDVIYMEATEVKYIELACRQVRELLHLRYPKIPAAEDPDDPRKDPIYVRSMQSYKEEREAFTETFAKMLTVIGCLSLLIGGVGVMNIMLVTVHERTREIGLRKALGARRRDIAMQFIMEAVMICLVGGALGTGLALIGCQWIAKLPDEANMPDPEITTVAITVAVVVTLSIGLFFGIYPAIRAARLNPIECLRHQ